MQNSTTDIFCSSIRSAFNGAWNELLTTHTSECIRHVNESVFRYLVIKKLLGDNHGFKIDDEWKRIDMLMRSEERQAAIEFKFYDSRPFNHISGKPTLKGGAGKKNFGEFTKSLNGLKNLHQETWYGEQKANILERYFILIGTSRPEYGAKSDFMSWYYPAEKIQPKECELHVMEQHATVLGNAHIFGWLCKVA